MQWHRFTRYGFLVTFLVSCGIPSASSHLVQGSDEKTPDAMDPRLWQSLRSKTTQTDWLFQRSLGWQLQSWLFETTATKQGSSLPRWQTWFDRQDLHRIFLSLYQSLGSEDRRVRKSFSQDQIENAIALYQSQPKPYTLTEAKTLLGKQAQLSHILMNRTALSAVLTNYTKIDSCYRKIEQGEACSPLYFPSGSAWVKAAWRRSGGDFQVPYFASDTTTFKLQQKASQWFAQGSMLPDSERIYTLLTDSGARFHLVGLHFMLKLPIDWFWTSIWLGQTEHEDFAADAPQRRDLNLYRLCSVHTFQSPLHQSPPIDPEHPMAPVAANLKNLVDPNWCSNPYLEHGINNQKTQCIGCHQFAGQPLSQAALVERLRVDLNSLRNESSEKGSTDFVWSLIKGPHALAASLNEIIEYFDAYDPYNSSREDVHANTDQTPAARDVP